MGQVLLADEKADERAAPAGGPVPDRAAERRVAGLEGVDDRRGGDRPVHLEPHLPIDAGQRAEMGGEHDPDRRRGGFGTHGSVCTSTESTAGRSVTIGVQWSPASGDT